MTPVPVPYGKVIENLGTYTPRTQPADFSVNHDRALYWMGQGAQLSDTVKSLFHREEKEISVGGQLSRTERTRVRFDGKDEQQAR